MTIWVPKTQEKGFPQLITMDLSQVLVWGNRLSEGLSLVVMGRFTFQQLYIVTVPVYKQVIHYYLAQVIYDLNLYTSIFGWDMIVSYGVKVFKMCLSLWI